MSIDEKCVFPCVKAEKWRLLILGLTEVISRQLEARGTKLCTLGVQLDLRDNVDLRRCFRARHIGLLQLNCDIARIGHFIVRFCLGGLGENLGQNDKNFFVPKGPKIDPGQPIGAQMGEISRFWTWVEKSASFV